MAQGHRDVVVVGAGPTGLALAAELLRHGLRPLVIDQEPAPGTLSRAIVVHARTLEVLEPHGIADELVARGTRLRRVNLWAGGAVAVDVSFAELPTRYPFLLAVAQTDTEAVLAARVAALGGEVRRGIALRGFRADADGVDVELAGPSGTERVRARWLVGCDGAHSTVRKELGDRFHGQAYDEKLVLGDVDWDVDLPRDTLTTFFGDGLLACFPMPGPRRFRLIATVDEDVGEVGVETLAGIIRARTPFAPRLSDPRWVARFRIHARQVAAYRAGRVFLAGDAAHIHSPAGGQGMNTGIQDAHNLAWKLALVEAGAPDALLDAYQAERHPVASQILRATDAATRIGTVRNPLARRVRDALASALSQVSPVTDRIVRSVAELDVGYPESPLVAGDLAVRGLRPPGLPVDPRHVVVPLAGPRIDAAGRRRLRACAALASERPERVAAVPPLPGFDVDGDGVLVVRPDGYVGYAASSADPEALLAWLDGVLGPVGHR